MIRRPHSSAGWNAGHWMAIDTGALETPPMITYKEFAAAVKSDGSSTFIWKNPVLSVGAEPAYNTCAVSLPTVADADGGR